MIKKNETILHKINSVEAIDWTILSIFLNDFPIIGFEEFEKSIHLTYQDEFLTSRVKSLCMALNIKVKHEVTISIDQNWNEIWESSYSPVLIDDFCLIHATFHQPSDLAFTHTIEITPLMSFGTGHHETTQLMIQQMRQMNLKEKSVLDFGCGTGILAILADKMEAAEVIAIDNLPWAVENTQENAQRNKATKVKAILADHTKTVNQSFDIIIVNIVRKVILSKLDNLTAKLRTGGFLLLSGFLHHDKQKIQYESSIRKLKLIQESSENNWVCQCYQKVDSAR